MQKFLSKCLPLLLCQLACQLASQLASPLLAQGQEFAEAYRPEYTEALQWVKTNKQLITKIFGHDAAPLVLAIAFPEVVRYNELSNWLETQGLELAYVSGGSHRADFSIGPLQIKPSFAEFLEREQGRYCLPPALAAPFTSLQGQPATARRQRLERLKSTEGQLTYLLAFYQWATQHFAHELCGKPARERLRLLATAYNVGPQHSAATLRKAMHRKRFPYGKHYPGPQYNYADIAVFFFEHEARQWLL